MSNEQRQRQFLEPIIGEIKRKEYLAVDIETKNGTSTVEAGFTRPFLVGLYDGHHYTAFKNKNKGVWWDEGNCVDSFMREILTKKHRGKNIYAHNGGKFDFLFFLPWLQNIGRTLGYAFSIIPIQSSIQVLDVWENKNEKQGKWRWLDSLKLLPMSLQSAAKTFSLPGKMTTFDLNTDEKSPIWEEYNEVDCIQLYKVVDKFHTYIEKMGGEVGITAPSTAMNLFRRKYLKRLINRHTKHHDFIRQAYVGGRVENFVKAGIDLKYLDINSSYPRSMLEPMPVGECQTLNGMPPTRMLDSQRIGFVECFVEYPEVNIPVLPVKYKGKLIFPVGKISGIFSWDELRLAMVQGAKVKSWGKSVWYESYMLFGEMVEELYRYRNKSLPEYDGGLDAIAKLILNSTYGKFAQSPERKSIRIFERGEPVPVGAEPIGGIESGIYYVTEEKDAAYIMPQISAHITALSRLRLVTGMLSVESQGWRVYYCDTDSMVVDYEARVETSTALGAWKDEYPGVKLRGKFLGPKMYVIESMQPGLVSKTVAKGFVKKHRTPDTLSALQRGETVEFDRLEKVQTLARAGFARGPAIVTTKRSLKSQTLEKRDHEGNNRSKPITLEMWK